MQKKNPRLAPCLTATHSWGGSVSLQLRGAEQGVEGLRGALLPSRRALLPCQRRPETRDPFHFPSPRRPLMGWGETGNTPRTQGMLLATPYSRFSPAQVATRLSVVSWVTSLACITRDAAHRCEMPKVDVAIWSFCPRKREGNPSASPSLLPLLHFNASWNIHFLFLLGCIVHNIWKALSKQLIWGKK